ncbi:hypothetical protein ES708_17616 [subsurface metagenome]
MTKKGGHTPITDEEAEDWARRMIRDAEDLDEIWEADEWEDFTFMKLGIEKGSFPSPAARDVLARGRSFLTGGLIEAGISTQVVYPRPGIPQTVIRDPLGRFISWGQAKRAL